MQKIPKGIVAIAVALVVSGAVFHQYFTKILGGAPEKTVVPVTRPESVAVLGSKEVSATTTYDVPEADLTHTVKFTVILDEEGKVVETTMVEMPEEKSSDKQKEFSGNLTVMIKGKKLAELSKVDKVGKSTLTTDAFNAVLGDLKKAL